MSPANEKTLCAEITEMIRQIRYGEVVISIHDSEVVQIEKREKKRYKLKRDDGFNGNG
jgi:hypothetical protein